MSASQQRGKKAQPKKVKETPVVVEEKKEVTLNDIFKEKPAEVARPEPAPAKVKAEATPKEPEVFVDHEKLLRWAARLKTSRNFGAWGNGANFANHMIKDVLKISGKELSIEEASKLISVHTSVTPD
jgi:hypothetical protein